MPLQQAAPPASPSPDPVLAPARTLTIDGCPIHYWLAGPAGEPVVMFTSGATCDHRLFLPQLDAFRQRYRLLLWDVRGHGQSRPASALPTADRCARDAITLLDHLGLDRIAYVGQSFGGMIGQALIRQDPGRVAAAVMLGTTRLTMQLSWWEQLGVRLTPGAARLVPKRVLLETGPRLIALTPAAQAAYRSMLNELSKSDIDLIYTGLAESMAPDPGFRLNIPVLISHGDQDRTGNIARIARQWAADEPQSELAVIPHASHNANMDNPAFFNQVALDFLNRHWARRA